MAKGNRNTHTNEEEALLEELAASEVSRFIMPGSTGDSTYQSQDESDQRTTPTRKSIPTETPDDTPRAEGAHSPRPTMRRQVESLYQAEPPAADTPEPSAEPEPDPEAPSPAPAEQYEPEPTAEAAQPTEIEEPSAEPALDEVDPDEAGPSLAEYVFDEQSDEPIDPREKLELVWDKDSPRRDDPDIEARKAAAAKEIAELLSMSQSAQAGGSDAREQSPSPADIQSIMGEVLDPHELDADEDSTGQLREPHENVSSTSRSLAEEILNQRMAAEAVAEGPSAPTRPARPSRPAAAKPAKRPAKSGRWKNVFIQVLIILMAMLATGLLVWLFL
jgi:hypothetical protein